MSIFDKKNYINRQEFRQKLEEASSKIPDSGRKFSRKERIDLEKNIFGREFGQLITKQEFKRRLLKMRENKFYAKTSEEKIKLGRVMRYLEKLSDIDV